jgi:hypothetical protein
MRLSGGGCHIVILDAAESLCLSGAQPQRIIIMAGKLDAEIKAIKTLVAVLEPLGQDVRNAVLDYVLKRLNITLPASGLVSSVLPSARSASEATPPDAAALHIKTLKEQKQPKSAIEMAAIVAYYLSHIAPGKEHKETITLKDLETQFKIAGFKLPAKPQFTLTNTKNAGYLDSTGGGAYKLNPVGYNLVVHSLPRNKSAK